MLRTMAKRIGSQATASCGLLALLCFGLLPTGDCDTLMRTVMATAGDNVTLPCPGLAGSAAPDPGAVRAGSGARIGAGTRARAGTAGHGGYLVSQLTWECPGRRRCPAAADDSGRLAEFSGGAVTILGDQRRLSVDRHSWSLTISPAQADDSGHYSCSFNSQPSERRVVLVVL
ncbi:uncharacterized protein LOC122376723, partial [Amphibalanus amphitrite]|uniref:uncharacterized protein LOC122376723 n=1 Tax=Amphibalanus amphitrite TaxID=1232801 RepID=UPI001C928594